MSSSNFGDGQLRQLDGQQAREVAAQRDAHHVVRAVRDLLALPGLGHAAVATGQLADPAQHRIVPDAAEQGGDGLGVVAARRAWPHAQRGGRLAHLFDFLRGLAQRPAHGTQGGHLLLGLVLALAAFFGLLLCFLLLLQGGELLGECRRRDSRGRLVEHRGRVQRPVIRRLEQLRQELPPRGVGALFEQLRVGQEGAGVEVGDGVLAQAQALQTLALSQHVASLAKRPPVEVQRGRTRRRLRGRIPLRRRPFAGDDRARLGRVVLAGQVEHPEQIVSVHTSSSS